MIATKQVFMANLRKAREMRNKSQTAFAEELCIDRTRYNNWETGKSEPNLNMLARLSEKLDISLDQLIKGEL
jgi:transcriptional regulator with XRE-family HTH domain